VSGNSFGHYLRVTTFGESHGPAVGMVLDGFPSGVPVDLDRVRDELRRRAPGGPLASARREPEIPEVLSGLLDGMSAGTPISILLRNRDARSKDYEAMRDVVRPGHAGFSWRARYGRFEHRGGGRASGRETAARVLAGALARQALERLVARDLRVMAFVDQVGSHRMPVLQEEELLRRLRTLHPGGYDGPVHCPDPRTARAMENAVRAVATAGDSLGGAVRCLVTGLPAGLGDPVFDKLEAQLGWALLSIGAVRGVEFGLGFDVASARGSACNDPFEAPDGAVRPASNRAGGIQGGISTGRAIDLRVAVKPTPSIAKPQQTVTLAGQPTTLRTPGRHDPCVALRVPPVVEAMVCLVLLDRVLARRAGGAGAARGVEGWDG